MNHSGTIELETERLKLRRFVIEDAENMYRNWASEDEVTKFLTWPTHPSVKVTKAVLGNWIRNYEKNDFYNWAIELKSSGEVVGNISVVSIKENVQEAVLGYCMGTKWWGNEIMPEAGREIVKYLFEQVGFNRISANHDPNNAKSGRVMQKIGMTYEGTLRSSGHSNQGIVDDVWYSILKNNYCDEIKQKGKTENCELCNLTDEEKKWQLYENEFWIVFMADKQDYPGRCLIMSKRHIESNREVNENEWMSLGFIIGILETMLINEFGAELINWSCLMNDAYKEFDPCPHLHFHVRPRYRDSINLFGYEFNDTDFGHHYDNSKSDIPDEIKQKIFERMKKSIKTYF